MGKNMHRKAENGQSLVEIALVFPVLLMILSGILDLGRAYFIFVALEDGAGEGALYLSINAECRYASDGPACADPNNAEYRARHSGGGIVDWSKAVINVTRPETYGVGDPVEIEIEYSFGLLTPIIPQIVGLNPMTLSAEATHIILTEKTTTP